ncbi:MAG TPA: hypothetical protein VN037_16550 [Verrucomicrobiae bacterium]|jgi:hypothetical protein|nr:hypothetical protein [Verrucomicrobiae bacterium]
MRFPDAPLRGLYARNRVYESITGMQSFGSWLERLEQRITERVLDDISRDIPSEWHEDDYDSLLRLLEQIFRRRTRVPELLLERARKSLKIAHHPASLPNYLAVHDSLRSACQTLTTRLAKCIR